MLAVPIPMLLYYSRTLHAFIYPPVPYFLFRNTVPFHLVFVLSVSCAQNVKLYVFTNASPNILFFQTSS